MKVSSTTSARVAESNSSPAPGARGEERDRAYSSGENPFRVFSSALRASPAALKEQLCADLSEPAGQAELLSALDSLLDPGAGLSQDEMNALLSQALEALRALPASEDSAAVVAPAMLKIAAALATQSGLTGQLSEDNRSSIYGLARWLGEDTAGQLAARYGGSCEGLVEAQSLQVQLSALAPAAAPTQEAEPQQHKDLVSLAMEGVRTQDAKMALLTVELESGQLSGSDLLMAQHQIQDISTNKELLRSIIDAQQESLKRLINR